jgi:hypothetical protein
MEPIRLWSGTDEGALRERCDTGLLVMEADIPGGLMERMEFSNIEEQNASQQKNKLQEVETEMPTNAQGYGSRVEVPCCCPGCFSFDF